MSHNRRAFTLIELLVVIAIIAILAAILFPVFAQAKAAAKKAVSISNFKQMTLGEIIYQTDADDRFVISAYNETFQAFAVPYDTNSQYLLKPYMKNEGILADPMDPAGVIERETAGGDWTGNYNPENWPAGSDTRQREHDLNMGYVSDWGINYDFLQPVFQPSGSGPIATAISLTSVGDPGNTIMAIDSIWGRRSTGQPYGGGNYGVDSPCVYDVNGVFAEPGYVAGEGVWWFGGWNPNQPNAWNVFGGVWPWHGTKVVVAWVDGHAKVLDIATVGQGCNVQPGWGGRMTDVTKYYWDLN